MGLVLADDGWRIPDEVWAQMEPLLPSGARIRSAVTTRACRTGRR
jgi:hypothetical protein